MTTGNISFNATTPTNTSCGSAPIGSSYTRSWSGSDGRSRENDYTLVVAGSSKVKFEWADAKQPGPPNFRYTGCLDKCWGSIPFYVPTLAEQDAMRTRALKGVLGKYRGHDFSAAVALGELPETVKMVTQNGSAVLRAYSAVRRGRFSKALGILRDANASKGRKFRVDKNAASNWLALRYGWLPLCYDVHDALEAHRVLTSGRVHTTRLVSGNTRRWTLPANGASYHGNQYTIGGSRVILKTRHVLPVWESLGFSNPALLAWELLPFSFVVDWFLDVGSYLELKFTLPSGGGSTYIQTYKQSQKLTGPIVKQDVIIRKSEGSYKFNFYLKRTCSSAPDIPAPRFRNPFNGSFTRIADMMALARSLK